MEKLAQAIAHAIGKNLEYEEEKQKVIAYGLAAMFQMILILITIVVVGAIGGFYAEALIIFFGGGLLRKSCGGNHAPTFNSCLLVSISSICLMAAVAHFVPTSGNEIMIILMIVISYLLTIWLIIKYAPVDSPNKPIVNPNKIERLRKEAVTTIILYIIVTAVFISLCLKKPILFHLGISLTMASLWQALTLTKWSKGFFNIFTNQKVKRSTKDEKEVI